MKAKTLTSLYWYCQVVECGGFTSASRQTSTSTPTLSRAVSALEEYSGEKLIHRNAKTFQLTSAGEDYYRRFSPLFKGVDEQWLDVSNAQAELAGDIRVSCTVAFVSYFLQSRALEFMEIHPNVNIIIHYAQNTCRFVDEKIDIAITNTALQEPYLVQKKLFEVPIGFAVSPSYLQAKGAPKNVTDLPQFDLLSSSTSIPVWHVQQNGKQYKVPVNPRYQIDNFDLIKNAALAGMGICLMPLPVLQKFEQEGLLVHILKDATCPTNKTFLAWSDRQLISTRVKAFRDLIVERVNPKNSKAYIDKL